MVERAYGYDCLGKEHQALRNEEVCRATIYGAGTELCNLKHSRYQTATCLYVLYILYLHFILGSFIF